MSTKSSHDSECDVVNIYIRKEEITSKTPVPLLSKILSAVLYAASSFLITVVNKVVLTYYRFPSAHTLGLGQMIVTLFILSCGKTFGCLTFPDFSRTIPLKIWPLPLFYLGNLITGLGGTQRLSLPMFTVLRRFTILMTMIGEYIVLKVRQPCIIVVTVFAMVGGTVVAASTDLAFDLNGYVFVLSNDFCTAANNVYLKKKLETRDLTKFGLLFYNVLFMFAPLMYITWLSGDFPKIIEYDQWTNLWFLTWFLLSCTMGFILMYSTIICTQYNSPLTTTIVGCLKNILVTYLGMFVGGDYVFSITNFIGLNMSMLGSVVYTYLIFVQKNEPKVVHHEEVLESGKE
ncbi:UDP-N-acetylglucosamine/UDP-glucose/GDP-mannose transporter-like [Limulus polyphemus]|uniref:UDP-N-acetylglucosamine/UDP-glucose/GDP-mannose transporter-like n=1 Tax=Limulus polyphemus TaxID=6850 RepID=A0ABM1T916_LIMPO|nr:UDP-N-acetylglucosamine/UDP-glucose/GDP-mannose transporter-like [Limulus polyphemus]XP_022252373.1 UDP-N-acetylglucosamine/UDP-glucose/GDP-mannose transporter-like [Limulus polyphemus]